MTDALPVGHDVVLVANLIHYFSPEREPRPAAAVSGAAVEPGAGLLLADFWTDPTHTEPVIAALMAGEFAAHLRHGDVYSVDEVRGWLADDGLAVRRPPAPGRTDQPHPRGTRLITEAGARPPPARACRCAGG